MSQISQSQNLPQQPSQIDNNNKPFQDKTKNFAQVSLKSNTKNTSPKKLITPPILVESNDNYNKLTISENKIVTDSLFKQHSSIVVTPQFQVQEKKIQEQKSNIIDQNPYSNINDTTSIDKQFITIDYSNIAENTNGGVTQKQNKNSKKLKTRNITSNNNQVYFDSGQRDTVNTSQVSNQKHNLNLNNTIDYGISKRGLKQNNMQPGTYDDLEMVHNKSIAGAIYPRQEPEAEEDLSHNHSTHMKDNPQITYNNDQTHISNNNYNSNRVSVQTSVTHRKNRISFDGNINNLPQISLGQAKRLNRDKEMEVLKIHNRIRVLQMEEDKTLKKIHETRRKAKQMQEIQNQSLISHKSNSLLRDQSNSAFQTLAMERKESVKKIQIGREDQVMRVLLKKQEQARELKERSLIHEKEIVKQEAVEKYIKISKNKDIRQQLEMSQINIERAKLDKIREAQSKKDRELTQERKEIKHKEKMLKKLNKLEGLMLRKLQDTSKQQKDVLEEFMSKNQSLNQSKYISINSNSSHRGSMKLQSSRLSGLNFKNQHQNSEQQQSVNRTRDLIIQEEERDKDDSMAQKHKNQYSITNINPSLINQ
eukprot:403350473